MYTEQQQADHRRHEKSWLKPFTDTIPVWDRLCYTQRSLAREGKQFILWVLDEQLQPVVLDKLTVTGLQLNRAGPTMLISAAFGAGLSIGAAPQQVGNHDLFIWVPAIFDARFAPFCYEGGNPLRRELSWRFCSRMASNPAEVQRRKAHQVYFTEIAELRKLWPNIAC